MTNPHILRFVLVLFVGLLMDGLAFAQQPRAALQKESTRLTRASDWREFPYKLVLPGTSGAKTTTIEVSAKYADYRAVGSRSGVSVVVLFDPRTRRTCVLPAVRRLVDVYVSGDSGMLAVQVTAGGDVMWGRSFVEIPGQALDLEGAEARFEAAFDESMVVDRLEHPMSVGVAGAVGTDLFASGGLPQMRVVDVVGRIMHIDLADQKTQRSASVWIDLAAARIVRSIDTGGQERREVASHKLWRDVTVRVMRRGGPGLTTEPTEAAAHLAEFSMLGTRDGVAVVAIADPDTHEVVFANYLWDGIYMSTSMGMVAGYVGYWSAQLFRPFAVTTDDGGIPAVLDRFVGSADFGRLQQVVADGIRLSLGASLGRFPITQTSQPLNPRVMQLDLTGDVLHVVLLHPERPSTAAVWLDVGSRGLFVPRILRAEIEGVAQTPAPVWIDGKARLAIPGAPASLDELPEIDAKYTVLPIGSESLAVVHDLERKSVSALFGFGNYFFSHLSTPGGIQRNVAQFDYDFYVHGTNGLTGVSVFYDGLVRFYPAYFVEPDPSGGFDAAIAAVQSAFDDHTLERRLFVGRVAVDVAKVVGEDLFMRPATTGKIIPKVDLVEVQGTTLRLGLTNPITRAAVTLWFDLNTYRLTRASREGREMAVGSSN